MKTLNKTIAFLARRVETSEAEICSVAFGEFDARTTALTYIKGKVSDNNDRCTGDFFHFQNAKQLSRLTGVCPTCLQSGASLNIRGQTNRTGDPHRRSLPYIT